MPYRPVVSLAIALLLVGCGAGTIPPAGGRAPDQPTTPPPTSTAPAPPVEPATPPVEPGAAPPADEPIGTGGQGELEVRRLGQWSQGPFEEPQRLVIRDQATLERLWADLGGEDPPVVDFAKERVLAVAAGRRPSGGYGVSVASARVVNGDRIVVEVVETTPGSKCMTTMALTSPVELVAVRVGGPDRWDWAERRVIQDC